MKTTDELLREYLESKPSEMAQRLFDEMQANEARRIEWENRHEKKDDERFVTVMSAIGGHDTRIRQVERATPYRSVAPPDLEKYRSEASGSFHIPAHELEEAMKGVQARDALAQRNAVIAAVWKIAVAVLTAGAIFLGGSTYRDCNAPRVAPAADRR
jgi:hypothetical protein